MLAKIRVENINFEIAFGIIYLYKLNRAFNIERFIIRIKIIL